MLTLLRAISVCSVVLVALLRLGINHWDVPRELPAIVLVFGPHIGLILAALVSRRRGPCVAVLVAALASGLIGIPALRDARTFGEAGAPMMVGVFLVEGLVSLVVLGCAVMMRPCQHDHAA